MSLSDFLRNNLGGCSRGGVVKSPKGHRAHDQLTLSENSSDMKWAQEEWGLAKKKKKKKKKGRTQALAGCLSQSCFPHLFFIRWCAVYLIRFRTAWPPPQARHSALIHSGSMGPKLVKQGAFRPTWSH